MSKFILTSLSTSPVPHRLGYDFINLNFKGDNGLNIAIDLTADTTMPGLRRKLEAALMMRREGLTWEEIGAIIEVAIS